MKENHGTFEFQTFGPDGKLNGPPIKIELPKPVEFEIGGTVSIGPNDPPSGGPPLSFSADIVDMAVNLSAMEAMVYCGNGNRVVFVPDADAEYDREIAREQRRKA